MAPGLSVGTRWKYYTTSPHYCTSRFPMVFEDYLPFHVDNGDAEINIIW